LLNTLFLKVGQRGQTGEPLAGLAELGLRERQTARNQDLMREGDRSASVTLLTNGLAARYRLLSSGRRQITTLLVPGDFLDLSSLLVRGRDFGVVSLSPCRIVTFEHDQLRKLCESSISATMLLWQETVVEAAIQREWLVSMGRRTAKGQMAHLICELRVRLAAVGRGENASFHLPLTQTELADVVGLSPVHVNRILKELRRDGLVAWSNYVIRILDWERLAEIGEFNAAYLTAGPVEASANGASAKTPDNAQQAAGR
jgi:CRP-like cAMP-binding protein